MSTHGKLIQEKLIVKYKDDLYDITSFLSKHPGGVNTLHGLNQRNIDEKFKSVEHSPAAKYLLKEYKLDKSSSDASNNNLDESMEFLVDWSSAMLPQISKLGDKYSEWVNKPVDRPLILFNNPLFERFSKTPWYMPLVIWVPITLFLIINESLDGFNSASLKTSSAHLVSGILLWTLLEYTLHRFLFHMDAKGPKWTTFHFMIHGLHHKVPFDGGRLVFPPFAAAVLAIILYQPIHMLSSLTNEAFNSRLILAGAIIGYLCYDMIHYYIHYGSPANQYFYHIKRYHYNHHFVNHDKGFGISSPLWDLTFGTEIILKKLKYMLKW